MQQSLPIYAGLLCNQVGLKFSMGGKTAWSAGGHINLPALPYNEPVVEQLAYGMIMHEGGHESYTDYQSWGTLQHDPALISMANRLEDIRIERKQIDRYPGAKARLQNMAEGLCANGYFRGPSDQDSAATLLGMALLYQLRAKFLSQSAVAGWGEAAQGLLEKAIPEHLAKHVMTIAEQVIWCQNTAEVAELAASILDLIKKEKEEMEKQEQDQNQSQPQGQQGQGQQQPQPSNSQEEDDEESQGQSQSNASQEGEDEDAQGQQQQPSPSGDGNEESDSEETSTGTRHSSSASDAEREQQLRKLADILDGKDDEAAKDLGELICKALSETSEESGPKSIALPQAMQSQIEVGESADIIGKTMQSSRALLTRAHRIFEAFAKKKRSYREEGKRVDASRLWRPKTGDYRIFVEKEEKRQVNTAVQILVDVSGSMTGCGRMDVAKESALSLAMALHRLNGIKVATASFPAVGSYRDLESEYVSVIHGFGQVPEAAAKKFAALSSQSCTPTAEALLWAGNEMIKRKETRKIIFVLTDGYPEVTRMYGNGYRSLTKQVRKSLEDEGIEVVGVGIQIDVSDVFPSNIQVENLDELAGKIFESMNELIFKKAA